MQLAQMDAWMKFIGNLIPQIVMLVAAIMVIRKHRSWLTIALVALAALNLALPIGAVLTRTAMNQRVAVIQQQQNIKTTQELQQAANSDTTIQNYSTLFTWLGQGLWFTTLAFAVILLLTLKFLMAKAAPALPEQAAPPAAPSTGSAPEATC